MAKTYNTKQEAIDSIANDSELTGVPSLTNDNTSDNVKEYTFNVYYADQKKREVTVYVYDEGGADEKAWFGMSLSRNERARTVIEKEIEKKVGLQLFGGTVVRYEQPGIDTDKDFGQTIVYVDIAGKIVKKSAFMERDGLNVKFYEVSE